MDQEQIKQRFKQASDQVEAMERQLEEDIKNKVAAIRDDASRKFASAVKPA